MRSDTVFPTLVSSNLYSYETAYNFRVPRKSARVRSKSFSEQRRVTRHISSAEYPEVQWLCLYSTWRSD